MMLEGSKKNGTIRNDIWRRSTTSMCLVVRRNSDEAARDASGMVFVFI